MTTLSDVVRAEADPDYRVARQDCWHNRSPMARRILQKFESEHRQRKKQLAQQFGQLNGWRETNASFWPENFGSTRRRCYPIRGTYPFMDHALYYKDLNRRNAAMVTQPYGPLSKYRTALEHVCVEFELRWHVPPAPLASIYAPAGALFIVLTKPEHEMRWLPEQIEPTGALLEQLNALPAHMREP